MKRLKLYIAIISLALLSACNLVKDYKFDTNPDGVRNEDMLAYFASSFDKSRTEYVKAVRLAGLEGAVAKGGITCVVPNNKAFKKLCTDYGVASVDELPASLLRSLMEYLIFPGEYRCLEMKENANVESVALDGNPIWIKRSSNSSNRFLMLINDTPDKLSSLAYTVVQQDFLFRNGVVAQVVEEFPTFQPKVAQTQTGELLPDDTREPVKELINITDDTYCYGSGKTALNDLKPIMAARTPDASQCRMGAIKFNLKNISFTDDIVAATLYGRVLDNGTAYAEGDAAKLTLNLMPNNTWVETTAKWADLVTTGWSAYKANLRNVSEFNFTIKAGKAAYKESQVITKFDLTSFMIEQYAAAASGGSTMLSFAILDESTGNNASGKSISLCSKDDAIEADRFQMYVELLGPITSNMAMGHNKAVAMNNGVAVLTPESSFEFTAPAVSDGYNYAPENIIYMVKSLPEQGYITKYGLALGVNGKFTQAEMQAGVVKYISKSGGSDSFELKVLDYLKGIYLYTLDETEFNYITVKIN